MSNLEKIKLEIEDVFGRLNTSGDNKVDISGQISITFDFENEKQYDDVMKLLQEEYVHYKHNFELDNGLNVFVLMS